MYTNTQSSAVAMVRDSGDASPMTILAARFVTKKIGQTTPMPGCVNTIVVVSD